jgi:hypothetical protein
MQREKTGWWTEVRDEKSRDRKLGRKPRRVGPPSETTVWKSAAFVRKSEKSFVRKIAKFSFNETVVRRVPLKQSSLAAR